MGTEVLRPQDCLIQQMRGPAVFPRRKPYVGGNTKSCRKPATRPEPRRRSPSQSEPSVSRKWTATGFDDSSKSSKNFVMGQVTILKRGEFVDSKRKNESSLRNNNNNNSHDAAPPSSPPPSQLIVCGTERLGPEPQMVPKQIRMADLKTMLSPVAVRSDVYAGSAFSLSPSPSSLPLPSFFMKKDGVDIVDDSATKDLRRLLRLD